MRFFLAIDVPLTVADQLYSVQKRVAYPSLKPTHVMHITLAFFDDVSTADLFDIKSALGAFRAEAFTVKTGDSLDCFSNWNRLRVLYVPFVYNKMLNQIGMKVFALFGKKYNLGTDFKPHITLGRFKDDVRDAAYVSELQQLRFEPVSWRVTELALYESMLLPTGPEYKRIGTVKLN